MASDGMRYLIGVASVAIALGLRMLLDPVLGDREPFATFYMAIALTGWFGGLGPSLATVGVGYLAAGWFFVAPRGELLPAELDAADAVDFVLYVGVGLVIAAVTASL